MFEKVTNYFYLKISQSRKVHPIYILPTLDGCKVIFLNMVLLVMGLSYANNYILLLNFILFCLFLGSMFYTHFNLTGLKIISAQIPQIHSGELKELTLHFSSSNLQGHYFLTPKIKSSLIAISDPKIKYSLNVTNNFSLKFYVQGKKRGNETLNKIYLETLFPFNFFRCFTFFTLDQQLFVYPEIKTGLIKNQNLAPDLVNEEGDEFYLKEYQNGDSLKRVDWKKLAQTNKWYTRQFDKKKPQPVMLICGKNESEDSLSSLCYSIHELHNLNIPYGLQTSRNHHIPPGLSSQHLQTCLRELAIYET